jgi:hypothetical protein
VERYVRDVRRARARTLAASAKFTRQQIKGDLSYDEKLVHSFNRTCGDGYAFFAFDGTVR